MSIKLHHAVFRPAPLTNLLGTHATKSENQIHCILRGSILLTDNKRGSNLAIGNKIEMTATTL